MDFQCSEWAGWGDSKNRQRQEQKQIPPLRCGMTNNESDNHNDNRRSFDCVWRKCAPNFAQDDNFIRILPICVLLRLTHVAERDTLVKFGRFGECIRCSGCRAGRFRTRRTVT